MLRNQNSKPYSDPFVRIGQIRVKTWAGLIFALGIMVLFLVALPQVRWFFLLTIPPGLLIGAFLYWLNRRRE